MTAAINRSVSLLLYTPVQNKSGFIMNATRNLEATWRRSIRTIGGFWLGSAKWEGTTAEMLDIFQNGMQYEIRETSQGITTWEGFVAEMYLKHKGVSYYRSWSEIANRVKTIYSKIGKNLIDNPGCETAAWDAYNSPSTRERSSTWATQGSYSCHVVADSANDGVIIDSSISITARKAYSARVTVYIISGTWRLEIYDSNGSIDAVDESIAGQTVMYAGVGDNNASTTVGMRLYCTTSSGEIYADAAVFQLAPTRAETAWFNNTVSQAEYGVMEEVLLQAGMTDDAANALARTTRYRRNWCKTKLSRSIEVEPEDDRNKDELEIIFCGYAFTLRNKYSGLVGTEDEASDLITNIIAEQEFVLPGSIQPNTLNYNVDDREAYRSWDLIRDIVQSGDASGNRWVCGVYAGRRFRYERASNEYVARIRNGELLDVGGGPLQGWFAEPGLIALDDIPLAPGTPTGSGEDNPKAAWVDEVEFDLGEWIKGDNGIKYRRGVL